MTFLSATALYAQQTEKSITIQSAEGKVDVIDLPEGMLSETDSLYLDWVSKHYINMSENCTMTSENPVVSDSIYMSRLQRIPAIIEMPYNDIVRKFIDMYATRLRQKVAFMLSANNLYMPIFEEALDLYDLPLELKYLPVIESALNPTATSSQGAVGLWQFMLRTGKVYGLKTTSLVDERRDPIKSTWAAVRYLKDLYEIYHDWNLVLAAYNCGPGTINKAIRRAGGATDFWTIYNYLPKETRGSGMQVTCSTKCVSPNNTRHFRQYESRTLQSRKFVQIKTALYVKQGCFQSPYHARWHFNDSFFNNSSRYPLSPRHRIVFSLSTNRFIPYYHGKTVQKHYL